MLLTSGNLYLVAVVVVACVVCVVEAQRQEPVDATQFCFGCSHRRNHKDLYKDEEDCHRYYQCFYANDGTALGFRRSCPPQQFWSDKVLSCLPEDPINRCQAGTADGSRSATTLSPPATIADGTICRDGYKNYLRGIEGLPDHFVMFDFAPGDTIDESNLATFAKELEHRFQCPRGTTFRLSDCGCTNAVETTGPPAPSQERQCLLYLPFDRDSLTDASLHQFEVFSYGSGSKFDNETFARGVGSLSLTGGPDDHLEVPGLKSVDLGKSASWCLFYKCGSNGCSSNGGLLSNNKDDKKSQFSFTLASLAGNSLSASINVLLDQAAPTAFTATGTGFSSTDFVQVCVVYDCSTLSIYVDKQLAASVAVPTTLNNETASLTIGHCPYSIGNDQRYGSFNGHIDEVLICQHALSQTEIEAHFTGQSALRSAGLIPGPMLDINPVREKILVMNYGSTCYSNIDNGLCPTKMPSDNGQCYLQLDNRSGGLAVIQSYSNRVIWSNDLWGSHVYHPNVYMKMQSDGRLVIYTTYTPLRWTNVGTTGGIPPYRLVMQTNCLAVIYDSYNRAIWKST